MPSSAQAEGVELYLDSAATEAAAEAAAAAAAEGGSRTAPAEEAGEVAGEAPPLALVACAPSGGDGSLGVHLLRRVSGARDGSAP